MQYIALLRGINVSGKNKIPMAELRALCEALSLENVQTYIQSGNIVFESNQSEDSLIAHLHNGIKEQFGFDVPVMVLSSDALKEIVNNFPFDVEVDKEGSRLFVTLFDKSVALEASKVLESYKKEGELLSLEEGLLYMYCPQGYSQTKLINGFIEKKLGVVATTRNMKTLTKLVEMGEI